MERALVLGAGGLAGVGWLFGVLTGLRDAGVNALDADLLIGTSAGASVGAQVTSGVSLGAQFRAQLRQHGVEEYRPQTPGEFVRCVRAVLARPSFVARRADPATLRRAVGTVALERLTVAESVRREYVANRLPSHHWPVSPRLLITAVDVATGDLAVFHRGSGVHLVDAVAASTAVPGVWPPVSIHARRYVDGALHSATNLHLVRGCGRVLLLAPTAAPSPRRAESIVETAQVQVVRPDPPLVGDPFDPAGRPVAARAGYAHALRVAEDVRSFWH
jgi:NTE family protein